MKKIAGVIVLIISVITGIYLLCFYGNPVSYSEYIVSREQFDGITEKRIEKDDLLEMLTFDDETLFFDHVSGTFYYSLMEGSAGAYNPRIKIKSENKDIKIAFLEDEITEEGIKKNQTITFLVYDSDTYSKYDLKCTTLPLMNIECSEEITEDSVPMSMTLLDNGQGTAVRAVFSDGKIHIRGATASAYPKKGYRFSLTQESVGGNARPNHVSLLGMRQDDDWLLYAAYNDQEKIRNVFSSNLWKYTCAADNAQGIDAGMEYKYLELFINNEYQGLYALGYPIDEKQMGIDAESGDAVLYKHGLGTGERLRFTKDGDIAGNMTGEAVGDSEDWSLLLDYYYDLYLNADNNEKLYAGIDIDNAINFYLFINLAQGVDNVDLIKNFYILVQNRQDTLSAIYAPWDLDLSWGNIYIDVPSENFTHSYAMPERNCIIENGYMNQLLVNGDPSLWEKIFEKYRKFRENGWSEENINALLDEYEADIYGSGAYLRDRERWTEGTYADAEEGLNTFRAYVMRRLKETDLYYERLEALCHETENLYIRRSAGYKDFFHQSLIIEINNKDLLKDSDYVEFFEYIGIDVSAITDEVRFILGNPAERKFEYLSALGEEEDGRETCIGRISFNKLREGVYEVKLNGVECYNTTIFSKPEIAMVVVKDTLFENFDFVKGYDIQQEQTDVFAELSLYLDALSDTNYRSVIEINYPDIWRDPAYVELFKKLGIAKEDIHADTDFIVWNGLEKAAFTADGFHGFDNSCETPLGFLGLFGNEKGEYGVYLDGRECFVSAPEKDKYEDIRIVLLDPDTYEVVDYVTFYMQ